MERCNLSTLIALINYHTLKRAFVTVETGENEEHFQQKYNIYL